MSRVRYQVRFTKTGLLRWTSHRDLARLWERLLRRSGLQLSMTEGFNPKPRIGFPSALALGTESLDEVVELDLAEEISPDELFDRLAGDAAEGLQITRVCRVPEGHGKAQLECGHFVVEVPQSEPLDEPEITSRIAQIVAAGTLQFTRKEKTVTADVQEQIVDLAVRGGRLEMVLRSSRTASLRPDDVLSALGLQDLIEAGGRLIRVRTQLDREIDSAHCVDAASCLPRVDAAARPESSATEPMHSKTTSNQPT